MWSREQLVDETEPLFRAGFGERGLHRRTSQYRNPAHIDSIYFKRQRRWIASVIGQPVREQLIAAELLP